ncbi:hypothetical protein CPC08DRAFT_431103 [Agrocybe pediades]|nr:hypothetical protein CPC08DRAFT_431103 [Agrocybe pediades]
MRFHPSTHLIAGQCCLDFHRLDILFDISSFVITFFSTLCLWAIPLPLSVYITIPSILQALFLRHLLYPGTHNFCTNHANSIMLLYILQLQ